VREAASCSHDLKIDAFSEQQQEAEKFFTSRLVRTYNMIGG
jgi:hypothetical protein